MSNNVWHLQVDKYQIFPNILWNAKAIDGFDLSITWNWLKPSPQLHVQSKQYKHYNMVWNMFKVNNKDTRTTPMASISKKRNSGLCDNKRPARKHWLDYINQLRRSNYSNIIKIWRTIESSDGLQSDPAGNLIKLRNKHFTKNLYIPLNKNLQFVPTVKTFSEKLLDEEINDFYQIVKMKAHFSENNKNKALQTFRAWISKRKQRNSQQSYKKLYDKLLSFNVPDGLKLEFPRLTKI